MLGNSVLKANSKSKHSMPHQGILKTGSSSWAVFKLCSRKPWIPQYETSVYGQASLKDHLAPILNVHMHGSIKLCRATTRPHGPCQYFTRSDGTPSKSMYQNLPQKGSSKGQLAPLKTNKQVHCYNIIMLEGSIKINSYKQRILDL